MHETAALLAVDPVGLRGAVLVGAESGDEQPWLDAYAALLPAGAGVRRLPASVTEDRLLGGLDLAATIALGRAVSERGALAAADGGTIVLAADRARADTWHHLTRALDDGAVQLERDGSSERHAARFAVVAVDERGEGTSPMTLVDRVAFLVDVRAVRGPVLEEAGADGADVARAREALPQVRMSDARMDALVLGADALGIRSVRVALLAVACARASAALREAADVSDDDVACAARLVYGPRAAAAAPEEAAPPEPADAQPDEAPDAEPEPAPPRADAGQSEDPEERADDKVPTDIVVRAAQAALQPGLLAAAAARATGSRREAGRAGEARTEGVRGRQIGVRRGDARGGARMDLVATLRAAAPFQRIRRATRSASPTSRPDSPRVLVVRDDFRVRRCTIPSRSTTLFVVDVSGSAALARLAEAKGAVEIMLTEGYARRERVALIAFRGAGAELVLPPTGALARARRAIGALAGGGGTPLAAGLDLAARTADEVRRSGSQVTVVLLTDGRANVARDGTPGRAAAERDALQAAERLRAGGATTVVIDTAVRPLPFARELATALAARLVTLPAGRSTGAPVGLLRAVAGDD